MFDAEELENYINAIYHDGELHLTLKDGQASMITKGQNNTQLLLVAIFLHHLAEDMVKEMPDTFFDSYKEMLNHEKYLELETKKEIIVFNEIESMIEDLYQFLAYSKDVDIYMSKMDSQSSNEENDILDKLFSVSKSDLNDVLSKTKKDKK